MNIGFIGLGQMGRPMVERLKAAGHSLKVYNRTRSSPEIAAHAQEVLDAEVVITMLADDAAVRAVWLDSGLAERLLLAQTRKTAAELQREAQGSSEQRAWQEQCNLRRLLQEAHD